MDYNSLKDLLAHMLLFYNDGLAGHAVLASELLVFTDLIPYILHHLTRSLVTPYTTAYTLDN